VANPELSKLPDDRDEPVLPCELENPEVDPKDVALKDAAPWFTELVEDSLCGPVFLIRPSNLEADPSELPPNDAPADPPLVITGRKPPSSET